MGYALRLKSMHSHKERLTFPNYQKGGTKIGDVVALRGSITIHADSLYMARDYESAISFGELYKGLKKSQRNVIWKDSVAAYAANNLKNTYRLRQSLLNGSYSIDPYQRFLIHEPKTREIIATRIKDRQFQRSLCDNVLYPQITRGFIRDNCACQRGKGVDDALDRMDAHLHRYYRKHGANGWVLKCDIRHYFAETKHDVAKAAIRAPISDDEAYRRAAEIIDSFGGDTGIGLGSQVSQLVQLAVLDKFDHYVKERLRVEHYMRYMDDFIFIHEDKDFLEKVLADITERLAELGLSLNAKTHIHPLKQGIVYLKWHFYLTDSGKVIRRMNKQSIVDERRKLRKLKEKLDAGLITMKEVEDNYQSWKANAKRGNTRSLLLQMDAYYKSIFQEVPP